MPKIRFCRLHSQLRILIAAAVILFPRALHADSLIDQLKALAPHVSRNVLSMALKASGCAVSLGSAPRAQYLGVVDYSLPSSEKRFWIFDTEQPRLLWEELVAHGKNSGENYASVFSNRTGSLQSSLGLFRTGASYTGKNGYSLQLVGLEPEVNDLAADRAIVLHGASYVSEDFIREHGRLGRSWGCPAVRPEITTKVINTLENNAFLFVYYPDQQWESQSTYLNKCE